ncbi:hypothetical protein GW17_00051416, partial [Ensete ventricosum]
TLALLHPHCAVAVAVALRRRLLPLPADSHPAKGRPPLRPTPPPLPTVGLAAGGSPLRAPYSQPPLRAPRCKQLFPWAPMGGRLWASSRPSLRSLQKCSKNA